MFAVFKSWLSREKEIDQFFKDISYHKEAEEIGEIIGRTHPHLVPKIGMPLTEAIRLILQYLRETRV